MAANTSCLILLFITLGCEFHAQEKPKNPFRKQAKVVVQPRVLDDYVGTYRLPSGVLFQVIRDGNRLLAGTPPSELLAQSTRQFASNRIHAEIVFDRSQAGPSKRVNLRVLNQEMWGDRIDPAANVDPTQLIDVGGHRLRMLLTGQAGPIIVIEDGFGSSILMRANLQVELSKFARVVTYDHAGTCGSEEGPEPRHARQISKELHLLLKNAHLEPPYLLVGASIGGDYMTVFANSYPQDVMGIVRLDPTPDWNSLQEWMRINAPSRAKTLQDMIQTGNAALSNMMKLQEPGRRAEWADLNHTQRQARNSLPVRDIPVIQITGSAGQHKVPGVSDKVHFFEDWLKTHFPQAKHVLAEKSGHAVYATDPELVIYEIQQLLEKISNQSKSAY